jgi:hypothetical protein
LHVSPRAPAAPARLSPADGADKIANSRATAERPQHLPRTSTVAMAPGASPSNPYKRQIDAVQHVYECAKRPKISSSPAPSTAPDVPAPAPTGVPRDAAEESDAESDDGSWLSESSEEPSDESSEGSEGSSEVEDDDEHGRDTDDAGVQRDVAEVVNLRANMGKRPAFKLPGEEGLEDIRPFLRDFLPRLKAANEELETQKAAGQLQTSEITGDEEAEGEEPYIELVRSPLPSACIGA